MNWTVRCVEKKTKLLTTLFKKAPFHRAEKVQTVQSVEISNKQPEGARFQKSFDKLPIKKILIIKLRKLNRFISNDKFGSNYFKYLCSFKFFSHKSYQWKSKSDQNVFFQKIIVFSKRQHSRYILAVLFSQTVQGVFVTSLKRSLLKFLPLLKNELLGIYCIMCGQSSGFMKLSNFHVKY